MEETMFDQLPDEVQELMLRAIAQYVARDGVQHHDGSIGTVDISPGQLKELLAAVYLNRPVVGEAKL